MNIVVQLHWCGIWHPSDFISLELFYCISLLLSHLILITATGTLQYGEWYFSNSIIFWFFRMFGPNWTNQHSAWQGSFRCWELLSTRFRWFSAQHRNRNLSWSRNIGSEGSEKSPGPIFLKVCHDVRSCPRLNFEIPLHLVSFLLNIFFEKENLRGEEWDKNDNKSRLKCTWQGTQLSWLDRVF